MKTCLNFRQGWGGFNARDITASRNRSNFFFGKPLLVSFNLTNFVYRIYIWHEETRSKLVAFKCHKQIRFADAPRWLTPIDVAPSYLSGRSTVSWNYETVSRHVLNLNFLSSSFIRGYEISRKVLKKFLRRKKTWKSSMRW